MVLDRGAELRREAREFQTAKYVAALGLEALGFAHSRTGVGVKSVGQLDDTIWTDFWPRVFSRKRPRAKASAAAGVRDPHRWAAMTPIWENFVEKNQRWGTVMHDKIRNGRKPSGEEIHEEVIKSMHKVGAQLARYQPSFPRATPWNWDADREATLVEVLDKFAALLEEQGGWTSKLVPAGTTALPPEPIIWWDRPFTFTHQGAAVFQENKAARKLQGGVVGEMRQAKEAALKVLLHFAQEFGACAPIGVKEQGYMNMERLARDRGPYKHFYVHYQKTDFAHRIKSPAPPMLGRSEYPPPGFSMELRAMRGFKLYPSIAAARADEQAGYGLTGEDGCQCRLGYLRPNTFSVPVDVCRQCLAPQAWTYRGNRKATLSETIAFLIEKLLA